MNTNGYRLGSIYSRLESFGSVSFFSSASHMKLCWFKRSSLYPFSYDEHEMNNVETIATML